MILIYCKYRYIFHTCKLFRKNIKTNTNNTLKNKKRPLEIIISNGRSILPINILLLKEASLKNDAATINLAVNFLRVLSQTDASYFCSTLDDH